MTDLNRVDSSNLDAITGAGGTAGAIVLANRNIPSGGTIAALGCTLAANTTYYFTFGASRSPVPAETSIVTAQCIWAVGLIAVLTVETSVVPSSLQGQDPRSGTVQLASYDLTPGYWIPQNPPTAYVPIAGGATAGTVANMTVTVPGTAAGGCEFDLGNYGGRRAHVKVVVGATGGVFRVGVHGKAAA